MLNKIIVLFLLPFIICASENDFLNKRELPNLINIIPPPPATGSISYLNDITISKATFFNKNKSRYELATKDAVWSVGGFSNSFSNAFGITIDKKNTPATYEIIRQILNYADKITIPIKGYYKITRPFHYFHEKSCTPNEQNSLNGAYPSGHTTAGWALALTLSEINPERTNKLMKRGYDFGQSRVVCGVHWPSDVSSGYLSGAILFSELQTSKEFQNEVKIAKEEIVKFKAQ